MSKKTVSCNLCGDRMIASKEIMLNHVNRYHVSDVPNGMSCEQFAYYLLTGNTGSKCIMCNKPTQFNITSMKYNRLCTDIRCKKKFADQFKSRMIDKYGKPHLLNDPDVQRKMLEKRSISKEYTWTNGRGAGKKIVVGSEEYETMRFLDEILKYDFEDVFSPSPYTYYYMYDGKRKFYIPDIYIMSINTNIEQKDDGTNTHPHMKIDRKKEKLKDSIFNNGIPTNYIKIVGNDYSPLLNFMMDMKRNTDGD